MYEPEEAMTAQDKEEVLRDLQEERDKSTDPEEKADFQEAIEITKQWPTT